MKQIFTSLLLLIIINIYGQDNYFKAKITLANGETKEGYADLPENNALDNSISYKETTDAKGSRIKNDEIKSIIYYTQQGPEYVFERHPVRTIYKSFGKYRERTQNRKTWMLLNFSDPLINLYYAGSSYSIDENGQIITQSKNSAGTWAEILVLLKRPDETSASQMTTLTSIKVAGLQGLFRKAASYYFQDQPEFAKRIEANEFEHGDMVRLAKYYIRYKSRENSQ